jgi:hypothetical protein
MNVIADSLIRTLLAEWDSIERWSDAHLKGKSLLATICRLCLGAIVYHIWRQCNDLIHENLLQSEETGASSEKERAFETANSMFG